MRMSKKIRRTWDKQLSVQTRNIRSVGNNINVYLQQWFGAAVVTGLLVLSSSAYAMPDAGVISNGKGSIVQTNASQMDINQTTTRMAIDWKSFSLSEGEQVNISQKQSSYVLLNRVTGSASSVIAGNINAIGQVYFVNPNGVSFANTASVNVGGLLVSTNNISLDDFAKGKVVLSGAGTGSISNSGTIVATAGDVTLQGAARVENSGAINVTKLGSNIYLLDSRVISNHGNLTASGNVTVTAKDLDTNNYGIVEQNGTIDATSGSSVITISAGKGSALLAGALAAGDSKGGGKIVVSAGDVTALNTSDMDVSATSGNGGSVTINGSNRVIMSGAITANGKKGGNITIAGKDVRLYAVNISALGTTQSGNVNIGVAKDTSTLTATQNLFAGAGTLIDVSGKKGGNVSLLSNGDVSFYGKINAVGEVHLNKRDGNVTINGSSGELNNDSVNVTGDSKLTYDASKIKLVDPKANSSATKALFGNSNSTIGGNRLVVIDSNANVNAAASGAVYLFDTTNGVTSLISRISGSQQNDKIGSGGITKLTTGISDYVTPSYVAPVDNSHDTGNFVIISSNWNNGTAGKAGAVTWVDGSSGKLADGNIGGVVTVANSLTGSKTNDQVGSNGVRSLANGNYVVASLNWNNPSGGTGAVTWGNGVTGTTGAVSITNSLLNAQTNGVGNVWDSNSNAGITILTNGNYVVASPNWISFANGTNVAAGAVTWVNGSNGKMADGCVGGNINVTNSLVGSHANDQVGRSPGKSGVTALANGNYVVASSNWDNGSIVNAGAITWGNGDKGTFGVVSAANSLVGTHAGDQVGYVSDSVSAVTALTNGNYVIASPWWDNDTAKDAGAVTWVNGTAAASGNITTINSFTGTKSNDRVGLAAFGKLAGVVALTNGNYVIDSSHWANGGKTEAGAVTWVNGSTGITGTVSAQNSLVGQAWDQIGIGGVTALTNGNYVVSSPYWSPTAGLFYGAATWGNGATGITGAVSAANSLIGSHVRDYVGLNGTVALSNGNYVVVSSAWNNGSTYLNETPKNGLGAVTLGQGDKGTIGVVSSTNSLVGSHAGDRVGYNGVIAQSDGSYIVLSSLWDNGSIANAGAKTLGNGTSGVTGEINSTNSTVGTTTDQKLGQ